MTFQDRLENLRAKPEHVRRKISFWSAFAFSGFVFLFWVSSLAMPSGSGPKPAALANVTPASPSTSLVAGVGDFGKDLWDLVFGAKKVTFSQIEVLPGNK